MSRKFKIFLATACVITLGVMVYRLAVSSDSLYIKPSMMKIYNFNLDDNNYVTIKKDGHDSVKSISKNLAKVDGTARLPGSGVITVMATHAVKVPTRKTNPTTVPVATTKLKELKTTKPTTLKVTKKTTVINLPPSTKPATTKLAIVVTSKPVMHGGSKCPHEGEDLVGLLAVDDKVPASEDDIDEDWREKGWVEKGGAWRPTKCQAISKVAIIIPFRNREQQLKIFLRHMHPMLKRQLLDYRILVIEQAGSTPFNRAMLFNIGYKESLKFHDFKCFIFHDVDLIPENDKNYYGCPAAPRHLSVAIDKFNYRLPYQGIFGGAGAFKQDDFEKINGFSNKFWGWGGEDDDLYSRIVAKGYKLTRPSMATGRYKMLKVFHTRAKADPLRFQKLRNSAQRMPTDGLNSLRYKVQRTDERPLYTRITVEVNPKDV